VSKKAKKTGPEEQIRTTKLGSAVFQFKIDYEQTKQFPMGKAIHSDVFSVGGHNWRIECYPRGSNKADKGQYLSIFLKHRSRTGIVKAIFEVFLMDMDGHPCETATKRTHIHEFPINSDGCSNCGDDVVDWGWTQFVKRTTLENDYVTEGHVTIVCGIMVIHGTSIPVPPSDIGIHLGRLLDHTDGMDVSFTIDGQTFHAHRAVLAARSPVFRAELFGSMAEATMTSITLQEITPATFKVLLRFIYTDMLPEDELGDSSTEILRDLLAAADRYAIDRLKLMSAQKLWDKVSTDTVATTLACAETYNCPELKSKCIDFLAVEENFREAAFTHGYALLVLKFPSITAELRKRVRK
jgi:speckle-type POZ protein